MGPRRPGSGRLCAGRGITKVNERNAVRIYSAVLRILAFILVGFLILCPDALFANDKIEVGARVLYQRLNDVEAVKGVLTRGRFVIPSASVYYKISDKNRAGLEFSYFFAGYSPNKGGYSYTTNWHFYRTGLGYKRLLYDNENPGEPIKALIGARLDYYRSYLKYDIDPSPQTVNYNNLGLALNAEARYSIFSFWGEYAFVRLSGGDAPKSPSVWNSRGIPTLDLYGFAFGMGLVFGF